MFFLHNTLTLSGLFTSADIHHHLNFFFFLNNAVCIPPPPSVAEWEEDLQLQQEQQKQQQQQQEKEKDGQKDPNQQQQQQQPEGGDGPQVTSPMRIQIADVPPVSEVDARNALLSMVTEHCCWGKAAARHMSIGKIQSSSAFHVSFFFSKFHILCNKNYKLIMYIINSILLGLIFLV